MVHLLYNAPSWPGPDSLTLCLLWLNLGRRIEPEGKLLYKSYFGKFTFISPPRPLPHSHTHTHTHCEAAGRGDKVTAVHSSVCCVHTKGLCSSVSGLNNGPFREPALTLLPPPDKSSFSWHQNFYLLHTFLTMAVIFSSSFTCSALEASMMADPWRSL